MTKTISWYCGQAVGAPFWQGTETYECAECDAQGEFEVTLEEWCDRDFPVTSCPNCGQEFEDRRHYTPEPPEGPLSRDLRLLLTEDLLIEDTPA